MVDNIKVKLLDYSDLSDNNIKRKDQALALLKEEFPETHKDTSAEFFEWFVIAEDIKSQTVVGVITAQKYLPRKAVVTDIVVDTTRRGRLVGYKLWEVLCTTLLDEGYKSLIGYTELSNKSPLNSFKRIASNGPSSQKMIAIFGDLDVMKANCEQRLLEYNMVKRVREKRIKKEQKDTPTKKSNADWYEELGI
tara:strand:- start:1062 stop:1640 length:579 start_codon:yes stop_codon:yes gene_type:complete